MLFAIPSKSGLALSAPISAPLPHPLPPVLPRAPVYPKCRFPRATATNAWRKEMCTAAGRECAACSSIRRLVSSACRRHPSPMSPLHSHPLHLFLPKISRRWTARVIRSSARGAAISSARFMTETAWRSRSTLATCVWNGRRAEPRTRIAYKAARDHLPTCRPLSLLALQAFRASRACVPEMKIACRSSAACRANA
jgi:hypothetical protein